MAYMYTLRRHNHTSTDSVVFFAYFRVKQTNIPTITIDFW